MDLKQLNQDTRDSIRGKNNYVAGTKETAYWPEPKHQDLSDIYNWRDAEQHE